MPGDQTPTPASVTTLLRLIDNSAIRKVAAFLALLFVIAYLYIFASRKGGGSAENYVKPFRTELKHSETTLDQVAKVNFGNMDINIPHHLVEQANSASRLAEAYLEIIKDQYRFYYGTFFASIACGAVAAMLLIFVTRDGWHATNDYLLSGFVVFAIAAVTFASAIPIFQYKENIETNTKLYLSSLSLEVDISTFLVAYDSKSRPIKKEPRDFLTDVATRIKECEQVAITFDPSKIRTAAELANSVSGALKQ